MTPSKTDSNSPWPPHTRWCTKYWADSSDRYQDQKASAKVCVEKYGVSWRVRQTQKMAQNKRAMRQKKDQSRKRLPQKIAMTWPHTNPRRPQPSPHPPGKKTPPCNHHVQEHLPTHYSHNLYQGHRSLYLHKRMHRPWTSNERDSQTNQEADRKARPAQEKGMEKLKPRQPSPSPRQRQPSTSMRFVLSLNLLMSTDLMSWLLLYSLSSWNCVEAWHFWWDVASLGCAFLLSDDAVANCEVVVVSEVIV